MFVINCQKELRKSLFPFISCSLPQPLQRNAPFTAKNWPMDFLRPMARHAEGVSTNPDVWLQVLRRMFSRFPGHTHCPNQHVTK